MDDEPEEDARPRPQSIVSPSPLGFGRPKRHKAIPDDPNQRTPTRSPVPQNHLAPTPASPINLNQKNIRALVYQDKSASKQGNMNPLDKSKNRPSKNLSISSEEDMISSDSNRPDRYQAEDKNIEYSSNKNSKTLKKQTKKQETEITQIQARKTKVTGKIPKHEGPTAEEKILMSQIHEDLKQLKEKDGEIQQSSKSGKIAQSKLKLVALQLPTTKPIASDKNYMKPTKLADSKNDQSGPSQGKSINQKTRNQSIHYETKETSYPNKMHTAREKSSKIARDQGNKSPTPLSNKNAPVTDRSKHLQAQQNKSKNPMLSRSATPNHTAKTQSHQGIQKVPGQDPKAAEQKNKPERKAKKRSLLDDGLFNNDDLFAKLNQLTKLNQRVERQGLIENGFVDEENDKQIDLLEDMENTNLADSDSDIKTPDVKAIEKNLRKKIEQKHARKVHGVKKDDTASTSAASKSFIEQQIQEFKEQRSKKVKPSEIDFERLLNPKHKKKPTEIDSQCSFQPLLSKKSLQMASKLGDVQDRLQNKKSINYSRTPEKITDKENTFVPKIGAKSKYLDEKKGKDGLTRHERLLQMGEQYSVNRRMKKQDKEFEEQQELLTHTFKPTTSNFKTTVFDVNLAERASRWAEKVQEKVSRKKHEIDLQEGQVCSFKPSINKSPARAIQNTPESLYSSRFMQDGIKNYFTRLEQARKIKKEAHERLGKSETNSSHSQENWGRNKSVKKGQYQDQSGFDSVASFQTPVKGHQHQDASYHGDNREIPGSRTRESSKFTLQEPNHQKVDNAKTRANMQPYTDKSINDTINLLRKNLQGINIHLGN